MKEGDVLNKKLTKKQCVFNKNVLIRLSEKEYEDLKKKCGRAGLSQSEFIRRLVRNKKISSVPPEAYDELIKEIKVIQSNLDVLDNLTVLEKNDGMNSLVRDCIYRLHIVNSKLTRLFF